MSNFRTDLTALINRHSLENGSNTPGGILAQYLERCLSAWEQTIEERDRWWGFHPWGTDESVEEAVSPTGSEEVNGNG